MLLTPQKKRRKVKEVKVDLNIGNKETIAKVTIPGTLHTNGVVSLKESSRTLKDTTPDEAISTNGMLLITKYNIFQKYGFV